MEISGAVYAPGLLLESRKITAIRALSRLSGWRWARQRSWRAFNEMQRGLASVARLYLTPLKFWTANASPSIELLHVVQGQAHFFRYFRD